MQTTSRRPLSLTDVAAEIGGRRVVRRHVREFVAAGQLERAATVAAELRAIRRPARAVVVAAATGIGAAVAAAAVMARGSKIPAMG